MVNTFSKNGVLLLFLLIIAVFQFSFSIMNPGILENSRFGYNPNSKVKNFTAIYKRVSRENLHIDIYANFTEPMNDLHVRFVLYYKYQTYQKYAVNLWEDLCGWLNKTKTSIGLDYTFGVASFRQYSNLNRSCPLNYFRLVGESIPNDAYEFRSPLPAGRYRLDINFTDKNPKNSLFWGQLWLSVSDHRIEVY